MGTEAEAWLPSEIDTQPRGPTSPFACDLGYIDFYQASGITQPEVEGFLEGLVSSSNLHDYPLNITLQNDQGDYLAFGEQMVSRSGDMADTLRRLTRTPEAEARG